MLQCKECRICYQTHRAWSYGMLETGQWTSHLACWKFPSSVKWDDHISLGNFKDCEVIGISDCYVHFKYFNALRMFNSWFLFFSLKKVISDTLFMDAAHFVHQLACVQC